MQWIGIAFALLASHFFSTASRRTTVHSRPAGVALFLGRPPDFARAPGWYERTRIQVGRTLT